MAYGRYTSGPKKGRLKPGYTINRSTGRTVKARAKTRKKSARRNPPKKRAAPARRAPAKRATTRRKAPTTRRNPPRRATRAAARPRARRNPGMDIGKSLARGLTGALHMTIGKVAARAIPQALGLPQAGAPGLAIQAASALAVGLVAERAVGKRAAEFVLAGGLQAPLESAAVQAGIPFVSGALSPLSAYPQLSAYPHAMGSYSH